MSKNRFYNKGICELTEDKPKCIYGLDYVFCDDCTRHHMIHMQETHFENGEEV